MKKRVLFILVFIVGISIAALSATMARFHFGTPAIPFNNIGVIQIDQPANYSRVVAISDVHGMYQNLCRLLASVHLIDVNLRWTGGSTLLIVVGDSIDKGPDSIDVLDLWMSLVPQARAMGGDIIHSLGNHEAEFLADPANAKASAFLNELHQKNIPLVALLDPAYPRAAYLRSMPVAVRVGNWLFAHAGLYPQMNWPTFVAQARLVLQNGNYSSPFLLGPDSILEAHGWWKDSQVKSDLEMSLFSNHLYGVVFGHMPDAFNVQDEIAAEDNLHLIKIDSGMAPQAGGHSGHLLVFTQPAQLETMSPPDAYSLGFAGELRPLY